jgi:hypothetical protein
MGKNRVLLRKCHTVSKFLGHVPLGDTVNFLPLTEPSPTDSLGYMKVSQKTDAEKCD